MKMQSKPRRGILLLIVLSLLSLFVLIGVTFIVLAGQYRRSSIPGVRIETTGTRPAAIAEIAIRQLLNPPDSGSAMTSHGLLSDLYGHDHEVGMIVTSSDAFNKQLIELNLFATLKGVEGDYGGGLLTMVDGDAAGLTTRIISYDTASNVLTVESFAGFDGTSIVSAINGQNFVINGRPLNGRGLGYRLPPDNDVDAEISIALPDPGDAPTLIPTAILPNIAYAIQTGAIPADYSDAAVASVDEPWDAADFQNVFLGWYGRDYKPSAGIYNIPSFHRPYLVEYFNTEPATSYAFDTNAELWRHAILRPLKIDHPNFTGGNINGDDSAAFPLGFDPVNGPWDVDNDGDGVEDSVWIDIGLPLTTDRNGRSYRTLVAIQCIDLDGRLNLNAHGSLAQTATSDIDDSTIDTSFLGGGTAVNIGRGIGIGPADVSLGLLLGSDQVSVLQNRYTDASGNTPGTDGVRDDDVFEYEIGTQTLSLKTLGEPFNYSSLGDLSIFSSPPDIDGDGYLHLDPAGQPYSVDMGETDEGLDDPYEVNLNVLTGRDASYKISELEPLLRWYDYDAQNLPSRLSSTAVFQGNMLDDFLRRRSTTTLSFEVPSLSRTLDELLGGSWAGLNVDQRKTMFPFELFRGERMDLNRPFGDGFDSATTPNDVVDEPNEVSAPGEFDEELRVTTVAENPIGGPANLDVSTAPMRQLYARHLYTLMMLLSRNATDIDFDADGTPDTAPNVKPYELAQWAINVVDFFDSDSIMTPFEFDLDPSDGWDVDGDLSTNPNPTTRGLVWGCERPELLITETLGFHDVRTEDLAVTPNQNVASGDPNFDQRLLPVGSGFIELYNPWLGDSLKKPAEFYGTSDGVQIGTPNAVWRMLILNDIRTAVDQNLEPLDWDAVEDARPQSGVLPTEVNVERFVYFTDPAVAGIPSGGLAGVDASLFDPALAQVLYSSTPKVLKPGRYAVVGSAESNSMVHVSDFNADMLDDYATTFGRRTGEAIDDPIDTLRRIVMMPTTTVDDNEFNFFNRESGGMIVSDFDANSMQPIEAVVINPVSGRLNFSEPLSGYPATGFNQAWASDIGEYTTPSNDPIDRLSARPFESGQLPLPSTKSTDALQSRGTFPGFRTVVLQRLANPLRPFNALTNPYRTIDSMAVDLLVFNGAPRATAEPDDPAALALATGTANRVASFERGGGLPAVLPSSSDQMLWRYSKINNTPTSSAIDTPADFVFPYEIEQSLGYLNGAFSVTRHMAGGGKHADYVGSPNEPIVFPWLTWNNRPYANKYELLNVPRTSSSQLPIAFDIRDVTDEYSSTTAGVRRFPHLLPLLDKDALLYRIFEFVDVRSRFVGTERWYQVDGNATDADEIPPAFFSPPFNRLSRFRNPGKININTVPDTFGAPSDEGVLRGVLFGMNLPDASRDGLIDSILDSRDTGAVLPTRFGNPFRPASVARFMPTLPGTDRFEVAPYATSLSRPPMIVGGGSPRLLANPATEAYQDPGRNSYFQNSVLARLDNVFSTNSNTFAVWVTVGYFEVEPWYDVDQDQVLDGTPSAAPTIDAAHPDGMMLGQEVGASTGQIKRNRSFYIIDRSIPVGFQPGVQLNESDTVLLRRVLE